MAFMMWLGDLALIILLVLSIMYGGYAALRVIINRTQGDRRTGIIIIVLMIMFIYFIMKLLMI